jgi:TolA-binding protein
MPVLLHSHAWISLWGALAVAPAPQELNTREDQVAAQIRSSEDNLRLVETQYAERTDLTSDELLNRRYSDGEIQYLLGDWRLASVLLYDVLSEKSFEKSDHYPDALYYLADSLYQQGNLIGSRLYLRQLLSLASKHYREGLQRFLDIAGKLNEFEGIDDYVAKARELSGGNLPEDISYVYAKWLFKRPDLLLADRLSRADEVFSRLASDLKSPFRLQAKYFMAVAQLERGNKEDAAKRFDEVVKEPHSANEKDLKIKELASLSLGRVLYELGHFDASVDRYQEIPRESEYFPDSLYEIAWARAKKTDYQGAKNAVELLQLVAPDSVLKPEADILYANVLLKMKKYDDATNAYRGVVSAYSPVRDELDNLLARDTDPVAYFDKLLARHDKSLDVNALLPPVAVKWATTQKEVADAVRMVGDIEGGQKGLGESTDIADRILKVLSDRGLQAFPALQEGLMRVDAVESALDQADSNLLGIEGQAVEAVETPEERRELADLVTSSATLRRRFESMPKTEKELDEHKARLRAMVDGVDKEAFGLHFELQGMSAMVTAIDKWLVDTRKDRHNTPEDEKLFAEKVSHEAQTVADLDHALSDLRARLQGERELAGSTLDGDSAIRAQLEAVLKRQHEVIAQAETRLGPDAAEVIARAHKLRGEIAQLKERVGGAQTKIQANVARQRDVIRERVRHELALLTDYGHEVDGVSGDARHLVGRIAFDSFKQVRRQFYELVLKADVGMVDVAFTKKQDQTAEIQKVSQQKDRELKALDDEFKDVLKDVE